MKPDKTAIPQMMKRIISPRLELSSEVGVVVVGGKRVVVLVLEGINSQS